MADTVLTMGLDIGSAASKCVILADGNEIIARCVVPFGTGTDGPGKVISEVLADTKLEIEDIAAVAATGYGRNTFSSADYRASELTCHARGAEMLLPSARTVVDIGGQDVKVLSLTDDHMLSDFVMNDKCASGTGRFLEVMARVLNVSLVELADYDERAEERVSISSTCTVFAESEVISKLSSGVKIPNIVAGIHDSVAVKTAGLVKRLGCREPILMTGGVSRNSGVVKALERMLGVPVKVSPMSQSAGAIGAAIIAFEKNKVV